MQLQGSIALITGGCQGLGRAFSRELLKRGAKVSAVDINENAGKKFASECDSEFGKDQLHFINCDVTNSSKFEGAFEETISRFGKLDIICNNAGAASMNWRKMVDLNLSSVIHGTFLGIKHMGTTNGGNGGLIINVASMAGLYAFGTSPTYTATKHGVVGFSKSFKHLYANEKVKVKCLCPSFAPTGLVQQGVKEKPQMQKFIDKIGLVPIEEVANGFMHLVNDESEENRLLMVTPKGLAYVKTIIEEHPIEIQSSNL